MYLRHVRSESVIRAQHGRAKFWSFCTKAVPLEVTFVKRRNSPGDGLMGSTLTLDNPMHRNLCARKSFNERDSIKSAMVGRRSCVIWCRAEASSLRRHRFDDGDQVIR